MSKVSPKFAPKIICPKNLWRFVLLIFIISLSVAGYLIYKHKTSRQHGGATPPAVNDSLNKYLTNLVQITKLESALVPKDDSFIINQKEFSELYLKTFFYNYKATQTYELINLDFNFFYQALNAEVYIKYTYDSYNKLENSHVDIHYQFTPKNKR